ncbi:RNA polymerase sigma factor [Cellulomonas persica]|uniref:RNA polymerase sigma factor n=1 Tax=Cellulomonas persica TaxID=76861 RepID=UPI001FEE5FFC|nr:RNA polymerase sigma factor [Cellulomonas persica]
MSILRDERQAPDTAAARFATLWDENAPRVQAYAARHVGVEGAEDVVAEAFLVAWRRLGDVPDPALPWLLVVARNTIANGRRSSLRRRALEAELTRVAHLMGRDDDPHAPVGERESLLGALAQLTGREREALLLVGWDGLGPADAARVAGCSPATFRMRLSRARRRLTEAADGPAHAPGTAPAPDPAHSPDPAHTPANVLILGVQP